MIKFPKAAGDTSDATIQRLFSEMQTQYTTRRESSVVDGCSYRCKSSLEDAPNVTTLIPEKSMRQG